MESPLSGVKVLELSTFVAAPSCARLLSDLGATVIKVEPLDGDLWRKTSVSYCPTRFSKVENPVFDLYNTGKKHIALNLKTEEGMEIFHKLLSQSDVFVTNNRMQSLCRLGISYKDIKEKYPKLIYASVLGYGENGPDANKPAFDTTAFWARSGLLRDTAVAGEHYHPTNPPFGVGDTLTGVLLMGEICAALYRRLITGKGDYVRSGLYHNAVFSTGIMSIITQRPFGRTYPKPRAQLGVPDGMFQCKDGEWVFVAMSYGPKMIPLIHKAMNAEYLLDDERFRDAKRRWENIEEYYCEFKKLFLTKTSEEWVEIFEEADLPLTIVNHYTDVSEDKQAWANGYLEHVEFATGNVDVMPSSPIEMDSVGKVKTTPAPQHYADTVTILSEFGYSNEQIEAMSAAGVIRKGEEE